ncbi:ABC transporter permease [Aestuariibaculum lutulentum]|uniref:ABC transporter permease n=1 Tax=Aestuariibaculum lutulentum TaxID=2920935 RepID=A0ABS9RF69_9FLAO|nr:ABC transporter permease subunit [Aestuariibaculum lutulentum]MCH4551141.1 ABC transporter permease [Aestuariibaculum lutulentum]
MAISYTDFSFSKSLNKSVPIWAMVRKEISDHIRSWQFIILLMIIVFTFFASMYIAISNLNSAISNTKDPDHLLIYLKLLTITDGSLPPFHVFISFLGPLLGISLGFNAINSEQQNGTLIRVMAQPIYRDNLLLSKFISVTILISTMFLTLSLLMIGGGLLITGVPIEFEEVVRILSYIIICVFYVEFWFSLSIIFSIRFKQAATAAIAAIGLWLFFTIFYNMIIKVIAKVIIPKSNMFSSSPYSWIEMLFHMAPNQLYTDATTTLLMPKVRSLGPMSMEQMAGAIPNSLPIRDSLLIVWPQVSGLISVTIACFALAYYFFMRKEIKC